MNVAKNEPPKRGWNFGAARNLGRAIAQAFFSHGASAISLTYIGNGSGILFQEYCFGGENSLSLTEFWGKLGEFCEELGEFVLAHK